MHLSRHVVNPAIADWLFQYHIHLGSSIEQQYNSALYGSRTRTCTRMDRGSQHTSNLSLHHGVHIPCDTICEFRLHLASGVAHQLEIRGPVAVRTPSVCPWGEH